MKGNFSNTKRKSSYLRILFGTLITSLTLLGGAAAFLLTFAPDKISTVVNEISAHGSDYTLPQPRQSQLADSPHVEALRSFSKVFVDLAKKSKPALVYLQVRKEAPAGSQNFFGLPEEFFGPQFRNRGPRFQQGAGSGFIVDLEKGYVITNNHVIEGAENITIITIDEREYEGKVIGLHKDSDVAVVQFKDIDKVDRGPLAEVHFGDSDKVEVGDWVVALGAPFQLPQTLTVGVVSALGRERVIGGSTALEDFIQTDAAINPGNSGGPLLDLDGNVIGINTAISSSSGSSAGIGFAVPASIARKVAESLINNGTVIRGFIGISGQDAQAIGPEMLEKIGAPANQKGAIVFSVVPGSPGEKAGFEPYDIITSLDGEKLKNFSELRTKVAFIRPGTTVKVEILRQGKKQSLDLAIGSSEEYNQVASAENSNRSSPGEKSNSEKYGLSLSSLTPALAATYKIQAESGVVITSIERNGLAARFGFQVGDVILEVNRLGVTKTSEVLEAFENAEEKGEEVLILIEREGRKQLVVVSLR